MASVDYNLVQYSGPVADVCLLGIMVAKRRVRRYRALTLILAFDLFWTFSNLAFGLGSGPVGYYTLDLISVLLQIALVGELLSQVLPAENRLAPRGRRIFLRLVVVGVVSALALSLLYRPPGVHQMDLYQQRLDLFTGFLICEAVIAMMIAANRVGLGWRNHVLAVGQGLMLWALSFVVVEGVGPYVSSGSAFADLLYYFRSLTYLLTIGYWSVSLWREEPARKPISPQMRKYIVALHDRVHYDLGKVGH